MAEYMRRFATGLGTYEFAEVRSDNEQDFEQGVAFMLDHVANKSGDPVQDRAVQNLNNGGLRTSLPGLKAGGLGGGQQQAPTGDDAWKGVELGKLEDGTIITFHATGKYGPHFKARNIPGADKPRFANLPKGMSAEQATLEAALAAFNG